MPTYRQTVVTYPNPTKRFLFVHIPRTAGRFLEENFKENGFEAEQILWKSVDGIEIAHFHNELYLKHFDDLGSIPHFTIVRNPIDRFFSASSRPDLNVSQSYVEDWDNFNKEFSKKHDRNWLRPQHEFVSSETKIWKYENGFGKDFCNWISNIVSFPFNIKSLDYTKVYVKDKFKRTKALIDNIRKFYKKDFEVFKYV